jgi:hypothetical protein
VSKKRKQKVGQCSLLKINARAFSSFRQARFATFPDTLIVHAKKFQLVNWVPTKLGRFLGAIRVFSSSVAEKKPHYADVPVVLPDGDIVTLDQYLGKGLQPDETELPNDVPGGLVVGKNDIRFPNWANTLLQTPQTCPNSTKPHFPS